MMSALDPWLHARLVCPRDRTALTEAGDTLICAHGHRYPCVDGIPVLLLDDIHQTHWIANYSLENPDVGADVVVTDGIDPFVREAVGATCGNFYPEAFAKGMTEYPIPSIPIEPRHPRETILDIGCNWGRWSFAARRAGFRVVGIDPSLIAVRAARRVSAQLGLDATFIVGDARYLPFADGTFDTVFSNGVLQHFAPEDVRTTAREMRRVGVAGGRVVVQMAVLFAIRSWFQIARRGLRRARAFEVRYWPPASLRRAFETAVGPARVEADSYFSLNAQMQDLSLLAPKHQRIVRLSDRLRRASRHASWLVSLADSVYVHATIP